MDKETGMADDKALVQIRIPEALKARVVAAAGGPRKISGWAAQAFEDFLAEKRDASPEEKGEERPAPDWVSSEQPREVKVQKIADDQLVWGLLGDSEVYEEVVVRAERKSYSMKQIVVNALAYMFKQYPLEKPKEQFVPGDGTDELRLVDRIVDDPGDCSHVWAEPVIRFGRRMSFCKKPSCEAKKLYG